MGILDLLNPKKRAENRLLDQIFNLKFTAKSLNRSAMKCQKDESNLKSKCKTAIKNGNLEGAKIYATDAIRKKHEQLNLLQLASRLDGVVARLETQAKMNLVNDAMQTVVKELDASLKLNDIEKATETMEKFERQFESLDVQTQLVGEAMGESVANVTPPEDVANLMRAIADEHGLEFESDLPEAPTTVKGEKAKEKDEIEKRLEALK
jgi:charged multivesicular body protein 1